MAQRYGRQRFTLKQKAKGDCHCVSRYGRQRFALKQKQPALVVVAKRYMVHPGTKSNRTWSLLPNVMAASGLPWTREQQELVVIMSRYGRQLLTLTGHCHCGPMLWPSALDPKTKKKTSLYMWFNVKDVSGLF